MSFNNEWAKALIQEMHPAYNVSKGQPSQVHLRLRYHGTDAVLVIDVSVIVRDVNDYELASTPTVGVFVGNDAVSNEIDVNALALDRLIPHELSKLKQRKQHELVGFSREHLTILTSQDVA